MSARLTAARDRIARAIPLTAALGAALLLGACQASLGHAPTSQRSACAVIISTNDSHGQLLPRAPIWAQGREVGGAAALAAHFDTVRAYSDACPVFVFSAGDMMQGTPISNFTDGESTIAAMNRIGYDAAAIGNHEFDWGIDVLRQRIEQASFPLLGANIYLKGTDHHPEWATPYAVVERDGVRIGVVGATTKSTPITTLPSNVADLEFRSIAEAFDRYIPEVRARGVDFMVVTMHAGGICRGDGSCLGEAISELQATNASYDYAITGHVHSSPIRTEIRQAPVAQGLPYTAGFTIGKLERDSGGAVRRRFLETRVSYVDEVNPDSSLSALVTRYATIVADRSERPIATLATPLAKSGREYPLGRLIADAQRSATRAQVAMMNNGGIRQGLREGPVTYGQLFEVQPFQNTLVRLRLRGSDLLAALEHALRHAFPTAHLSGLTVHYDPRAPAGSRVVEARLDDGSPIERDSAYSVAVISFMYEGGDGFSVLGSAEDVEMTGISDLDALIAYVASLPQPVEAPGEDRWVRVERGDDPSADRR